MWKKTALLMMLSVALAYGKETYTVQSGDTLWGIHNKLNVDLKELMELNGIENANDIKIGQTLTIPSDDKPKKRVAKKKIEKPKKSITKKPASKRSVARQPKQNIITTGGRGCDANAAKLVRAYPQIVDCKNNMIIWRDGTKMRYDDGRRKSFEQALSHADIQDMFRDSYRRGPYTNPPRNYDPGRYRNEKFFRKIYGGSSAAVRRHLTTINWFGTRFRVTTVNGVHKKLQAVARDLEKLGPKYRKYLTPPGGGFYWRKIAGTNRLSVHSFGAAIDINVKYSAYWRWSKGAYRYKNRIPKAIVKVFEKHGFIWGGKWYHYDTMHFEYRPELLR